MTAPWWRWLRRWALRGAALGAALGIAGFVAAASGVIPIKASAGHWTITEWMLQFGKRRSIATHTIGLDLPALDDPGMVALGAGQYDLACRPCHGSPDHPRPRVPGAMLPPPPYLPPLIEKRDPEFLFYVVKHGIKFTGMPAWPTQRRDDEVHAMVAFLLVFRDLDADGYRRLVYGDAEAADPVDPLHALATDVRGARPALVASCERCHGPDGRGRRYGPAPRLAGQERVYLLRALAAYHDERRHSGIMGPIAAALDPDEQRALADHFSQRPPPHLATHGTVTATDAAIERGRTIVHHGVPKRGVPPCVDCHGPAAHPRNPAYPRLTGQFAGYLLRQLELFRSGDRGGSAYAHLMQQIAVRLTPEQMRDAAAYYGAFAAEDTRP